MNLNLLDNPIWHALNSHHRHLAVWGDTSVRYQFDVAMAAAMPENNLQGFDDLKNLVEIDAAIALVGDSLPEALTGWQVLQVSRVPQLVCEDLNASAQIDAIELTVADVPEMLGLVELTQPGPFLPRTIEMGQYLGLRHQGKLVAMAGQRLHLTGFCEISAVCTHPDYRGRGYGGALTTILGKSILARQEIPFLHVLSTNENALSLYTKLGFRQRKEITLTLLKRVGS
jgi:ribosomal protein S18 acetylase RimI-like enzyme